ncbi:hypothetical protein DERF_002676 [Dermatophagoides farinae]|uniref:Uncharacterized protein n=1 Tax=Dermatophagoides farinae TaxID=6954 RepID=A0A922L9V5_DERFA|nr:hypothetical protein DERF_002676 [Dermatophagoides farinae]
MLVYWPWTRRVGISFLFVGFILHLYPVISFQKLLSIILLLSYCFPPRLVQLTLILGLIKCSFCDNTDMVILIRWFYHPKFCFEYYTRIFHLVRRDFDVVAVDGTHDWP